MVWIPHNWGLDTYFDTIGPDFDEKSELHNFLKVCWQQIALSLNLRIILHCVYIEGLSVVVSGRLPNTFPEMTSKNNLEFSFSLKLNFFCQAILKNILFIKVEGIF